MSETSVRNSVTLLGTKGGPAIRPRSSMPTSSLLRFGDYNFVIDCGLGVTRGLVDAGIQLEALDHIFITHLHSDHYLELGPLLHTAWTAGLNHHVQVYGPKGIEAYWKYFLLSMRDDIELRIEDEGRPDLSELVKFKEISEGHVLSVESAEVSAMRNQHPPLIDSYALRFDLGGRSVTFSGDTAYMPALADFAKSSDLLIHEAMLENALEALVKRVGNTDGRLMQHLRRSHTTASQAGMIAESAGVRMLAINHKVPSDDASLTDQAWIDEVRQHWQGELRIGQDGMEIPF